MAALESYLENVFALARRGDATEPTYYSALQKLLEEIGGTRKRTLAVVPLPKQTEGGNPDFRVWDGKGEIIGYIEAKDPAKFATPESLDKVEESEQLHRYRTTFPNLILTNFHEFRLYRNGVLMAKTSVLGHLHFARVQKISPPQNETEFFTLLEKFFSFSAPATKTAKQLALELAKRTQFLRDEIIAEELREERIEGTQTLEAYFEAFKTHLIGSLTRESFSDLFAQTITYGLFAARSRATGDFTRALAVKYIPPTVGVLRDLFRFVSSADLPPQMEWIVDDIAEVLAKSDVGAIIKKFYAEGKGRDPIVHFYETFLAEYDPALRAARGVYYTPEPVVGYIVRSVHEILKNTFGKEDGFATGGVVVLDPAAGTLTFPAEAIRLAVEESRAKHGEGRDDALIRDHILKNFYAFELMMAPYAVGHLKIGFVLDEFGHMLGNAERFKLYLTNALDMNDLEQTSIPTLSSLSEESRLAGEVKRDIPVMVVLGNPPYAGVSHNTGDWITDKIEDYKKVDGEPLDDRNTKWLKDDYVKFFRFAQWKIEQAGAGVLGFITNHAWLDNPTFRGMRASLLDTFDECHILNLHGSALKKEKTPDGGKDENVFDIRPGVAIAIFVKKP